jgi:Na+-transporting methylmalonyl-CoA/oxaloacetate decarboxylase gamma subunit
MVAKLALLLLVLAVFLLGVVVMSYRYFDNRAKEEHEKEMYREKRANEMFDDDTDSIDRELERERNS